MRALIAEIGNMHLGDLDNAFELIAAAKDCGATHAKMQAIGPYKPSGGSMPDGFYEMCSMTIDEYSECIDYGASIGIPVFFSIFDPVFEELFNRYPSMIRKISASQGQDSTTSFLKKHNNFNTIISIPILFGTLFPAMLNMRILCATPYNYKSDDISLIPFYSGMLKNFSRNIGLSDHSIGIENCKQAISDYDCKIIEKHFYLGNDIKFKGQLYRDCEHSANPKQFAELAKFFEEKTK